MKGVVLAGTHSGVGKTVATLATIRALQAANRDVQPAKAGPDFIDPGHHAAVAGRTSRTLDVWLQGTADCRRNYHRGTGDVCIVEGVMGLYDGEVSSTALVAEALDLPVVLVVDGSAALESVAATALGFREFAGQAGVEIDVAGIVAQRTHTGRHADGIREALPDGIEFFGHVPPDDRLEIPDRHLGLRSPSERPIDRAALTTAAETIESQRFLDLAREPPAAAPGPGPPDDVDATVVVAQDEAFRFIYPATMERLQSADDVRTVSPVAGDRLPDAEAIYLPGGYPELHGPALEESQTLEDVAVASAEGVPVYAECGGMMALAESIQTVEGNRHEMAGVLPATIQMCERYQALDHVTLRASRSCPIGQAGSRLRGHEFHYSAASVDMDACFAFEVERGDGIAEGQDGLLEYQTLGTYAHVHPASGAFDVMLDNP